MEDINNGYEKNYQRLIANLKDFNFPQGERLGFKVSPNSAQIKFLGRDYLLTESGVKALDGKDSKANNRSILIHYLLSEGQGDPGEEFLTLSQFPGVLRGRREPGRDILNGPIIDAYSSSGHEAFQARAQELGGVYLGKSPSGGFLWLFKVFPKIYMQVDFLEASDEFPLEVRVLFDSRAQEYLGFECLAFLNGSLIDALAGRD
ncbi:MAG: DUF3786 domain-containing protein [Deltaproteobacteria bacterium]|jgi:hypothetical protein|nr:DUF3786 domain-containing protein [Deltaproteobacteria bacterium]